MKLKLSILILVLFGSLTTNKAFAQTEQYLQENIAITDVQYLDQNDGSFIIKIQLKDFGGQKQLPDGFGLNGITFSDNGKNNDTKAGDGIYYSKERGDYKKIQGKTPKYKIATDVNFKHASKLGRGTGISCKFVPCGCPCDNGINCPACEWFGWQCWKIESCELGLGLDILML